MRTSVRFGLALMLLGALLSPAEAQQRIEDMKEFDAGDLGFRTHVHLEFSSRVSSQVVIMPDDGFSGADFRTKPDGSPSWGPMLRERDYNCYMLDHVGCGSTIDPPSKDILRLTEKAVFGASQIMVATKAQLVIAHGMSAGFALRGRSQREDAGAAFILIDPIGPQGSQDYTDVTAAELFARRQHLDDALWREWGFGGEAGQLRDGTDVTEENARGILASYERDQPDYTMMFLTPIEAGTRVTEFMHLVDVPVLVVRTTAADAEQIEREAQVVQWLTMAGCRVDTMDLGAIEGLENTTGLPWLGDQAGAVLDLFLEWFQQFDIRPSLPGGQG